MPSRVDEARGRAALLVVDMQVGDADADSEYVRGRRARDGDAVADYYVGRIREQVVPNTRRLLDAYRAAGEEVVFVRIELLTRDGRDRSAVHRERGIHFPPGSSEGRIIPELEPRDDELVVSKTSHSAFWATGLHELLENLEVRRLAITGVVTSSCVRASALDAVRLMDAAVSVVADATATWSPELQKATETELRAAGVEIVETGAAVDSIREGAEFLQR